MARFRCVLTALCLFAYGLLRAQTVYYPSGASDLLRSTAADMAALLQKALPGSRFETAPWSIMPREGIVLVYDSTVSGNPLCRLKGNGSNQLLFAAAEDNGLHFGVYSYLQSLGFRFYQPGSIWELYPVLSTPFLRVDTVYSNRFQYSNWFISGGYNSWALDTARRFYWDTYNGEAGHAWALYMRRNNMTGAYRFAGHRDDILTPEYLAELGRNPCFVAPYNGSRTVTRQSVPDVRQAAAMELWSSSIENKYTRYRETIKAQPGLYANLYRNFSYAYSRIGIEVPDGARWANSTDGQCGGGALLSESDQHFLLANHTAGRLQQAYPGARFQLYAYDGHAAPPSAAISLHPQLDVQVVPTAFQAETSAKGLLRRWYSRHRFISEYHYLNLAQWSGENPAVSLRDLTQTLQRVKTQQAQGLVWEAAPSKFASLPLLLAATCSLLQDVPVDSTLQEFCGRLFGPAAGKLYTLLQHWTDPQTVTVGYALPDNRYKLPLYFSLLQEADALAAGEPAVVRERLRELKIYLHYMLLYYRWASDQRVGAAKEDLAEALCIYLARIRSRQIVNSYFLISDLVNRSGTGSRLQRLYNVTNGEAYQQKSFELPLPAEIDSQFTADCREQQALISRYHLPGPRAVAAQMEAAGMEPLERIRLQAGYTQGKGYPYRAVFGILAARAGSVRLQFTPRFDQPGQGMINFTLEDADDPLKVFTDHTVTAGSGPGELLLQLPAAGHYRLSLVTQNKAALQLTLYTRGNWIFREEPFLGNTVENYRADLSSLPGWFYVPQGVDRIYFSLNNSNPGGAGFAGRQAIAEAFAFRDPAGNVAEPMLADPADSALWYLPVQPGLDGRCWQALKMEQYRLCLANLSNLYWYARPKNCGTKGWKLRARQQEGACILTLEAHAAAADLRWELYDNGRWYRSAGERFELPAAMGPDALVRLIGAGGCLATGRLADDPAWQQAMQSCGTAGAEAATGQDLRIYPNPGNGLYQLAYQGQLQPAAEILVFNAAGQQVAAFRQAARFDISRQPPGLYFYRLQIGGAWFRGRLIRQ